MRAPRVIMILLIASVTIGMAGLLAMLAETGYGQTNNGSKADVAVDANGNLHVPDDYRTTYQFLGSWAVAADQGKGSKELHDVYASPGTIAAYRKDGKFPDGAVLVKEVFEAATGEMTTGAASHAQSLKGWFVMMRDDNNRHPVDASFLPADYVPAS
jgi:cytochrome P460